MIRHVLVLPCVAIILVAGFGCTDDEVSTSPVPWPDVPGHGPIAPQIRAPLGQPLPGLTDAQLELFERGREVAEHRFTRAEGLGPAFNVTFCAACHEKPTIGGSAGTYRNFFLGGALLKDGTFVPTPSAGEAGGVVRLYDLSHDQPARPPVHPSMNVVAQRNPIPFFGVGLIAEIEDAEILSREDPDDRDGDGISGRANWDRGFVGRFGLKSQTVSIEGFIRGPLFNHLGITTNPLSDEDKARLPVDSSLNQASRALEPLVGPLRQFAQAAAPDGPLTDDDPAPDPEMPAEDLFAVVSFAMLTAAPPVEEPTEQSERGRRIFDELRCAVCHTPRMEGPRGPLPLYSDLLLHDMGDALADGIVAKLATGREFRTQPLWGLAAVGPYLHDGRAATIRDAILMHGGEAQAASDAARALTSDQWVDLLEFLASLGGRSQASGGLLEPDAPLPEPGTLGGPTVGLSAEQTEAFEQGRRDFDLEFGFASGLGAPRLNGDSCRACHFEPVIGGAGPRGVNVMRHGIRNDAGDFVPPAVGTILHRGTALLGHGGANAAQAQADVFEMRQTPHLFGLGDIEAIEEAAILAHADPDDLQTPDGITGKPSWTDGGRLGRFGWKAQVPSIAEFVRDAVTAELGMTLPWVEGLTFGRIQDDDDVPDPELPLSFAQSLTDYLRFLSAPPRPEASEATTAGEAVFEQVGCAACHVPSLPGPDGPVWLYSDLLLHDVLRTDLPGTEDASAEVGEFRTPPLWGVGQTAPYMHDGWADTLDEAIRRHDGEARASVEAYLALGDAERAVLIAFLERL